MCGGSWGEVQGDLIQVASANPEGAHMPTVNESLGIHVENH